MIFSFQHTDEEPCPIAFCERLCLEMTTDLEETRLQLVFLPVNVYIEDNITVNETILVNINIFTLNSREINLINIYRLVVYNSRE